MKKICTTKNHIKAEHKKDTFQKYKEQNQKNCTPMNIQHTHNSLTTQKIVAVYFKDVKLKKHSVAKTRSLWKLPICDNFFRTKNHRSAIRFCKDR